jgi:hypothetical protein
MEKKKWKKLTKKEKIKKINNYLYLNNNEQKKIIIISLFFIILSYYYIYIIIFHILSLIFYYYKLIEKISKWNYKQEKVKNNKPYELLTNTEKKNVQKLYKLSKTYGFFEDMILFFIFAYSLLFFCKGQINSIFLLIIFIFIDIFLLYDLRNLTKWYKQKKNG